MKKSVKKIAAVIMSAVVCAGMSSVVGTSASAASLSAAEKNEFNKIIKKCKTEDSFTNWNRYAFYDLNKDGKKDLLLEGYAGSPGSDVTHVYLHIGKQYKKVELGGSVFGVASKGFLVKEEYRSGAGAEHYINECVYEMKRDGSINCRLRHDKSWMYFDSSTGTVYEDGKLTGNTFYRDGKKCSASEYKKAYKKYKIKKWDGFKRIDER